MRHPLEEWIGLSQTSLPELLARLHCNSPYPFERELPHIYLLLLLLFFLIFRYLLSLFFFRFFFLFSFFFKFPG